MRFVKLYITIKSKKNRKMGTTNKYILMCKKATELQEIAKAEATKYDDLYFNEESLHTHVGAFVNEEDIILLRQDWLQEKILNHTIINNLMWLCDEFRAFENHPYPNYKYRPSYTFSSMEQLWLAFVMKKIYNKIWSEKDWIDVKDICILFIGDARKRNE